MKGDAATFAALDQSSVELLPGTTSAALKPCKTCLGSGSDPAQFVPDRVRLTLTVDQAATLYATLGKVGGDGWARKRTGEVYALLDTVERVSQARRILDVAGYFVADPASIYYFAKSDMT